MAQAKVILSRKTPSLSPTRLGKMDTVIIYEVDGRSQDRRLLVLPTDAPTPQEVQAAIAADLKNVSEHQGKTFTV